MGKIGWFIGIIKVTDLTNNFFKNFILGVTNECIQIDTRQLNYEAIVKLVSSAQHQIAVISRHLDSRIFNNEEFMQTMLMLAHRARNSNIRILVHDTDPIVKHGHRILDLSQRISSKVEIRTIGDDYSQFNESFVVADSIGYIHNLKSDLYDAEVNFCDKDKSKELMDVFTKIWEYSQQDAVIRRLCI